MHSHRVSVIARSLQTLQPNPDPSARAAATRGIAHARHVWDPKRTEATLAFHGIHSKLKLDQGVTWHYDGTWTIVRPGWEWSFAGRY